MPFIIKRGTSWSYKSVFWWYKRNTSDIQMEIQDGWDAWWNRGVKLFIVILIWNHYTRAVSRAGKYQLYACVPDVLRDCWDTVRDKKSLK